TVDDDGNFLPDVAVTLTHLGTGEDDSTLSGPDGLFTFKLKPNSDYTLRGSREDMLTTSRMVSTRGLTSRDTLNAPLHMTRLRLGEAIAINNIYYDYDSWDIRSDAARELDEIARLFMENPRMSFELGSHTDSRGGDLYNLVLSDARANAAVNYLIQRGVDPDRIVAKGYGEERLVNGCGNGVRCSEEEHQANRRTEFTVTSVATMAVTNDRP
ncbi:MAG TPA: OmpA family protein, partial [Flavobacteriales bacterium]|nr:OmpA family protein [Flavobacteriales bacterium]